MKFLSEVSNCSFKKAQFSVDFHKNKTKEITIDADNPVNKSIEVLRA